MFSKKWLPVLLGLFLATSQTVWAATSVPDTVNPHTGIHINARDAYEMKMARPDQVILLDVRTQAEIHHIGIADAVDANIPYRFETTEWKMKKDGVHGTFRMVKNPDFAQAVKNLVKHRNLTQDTPIIIMCKGGIRGPWAAKALYKAGFTQVYTQVEGFEGKKAKEGPNKGKRVVNGWKNEGLPWSYNLLPEKMYFNFAPKKAE
jgi:rhodanese-related sulfurtransferase